MATTQGAVTPLQTDRRYELTLGNFESGDGSKITDLQLKFDVQLSADNSGAGNSAVIEVFNLSRNTLGKLENEFQDVVLSVGYRDTSIQTILTGNITKTFTTPGADRVTKLFLGESYTALNHERLNSTVAPGKTMEDVIEEIRKHMPGVARGAYVAKNLRSPSLYGVPLNGSPRDMLRRLCRDMDWEYRVYLGSLFINDRNGLISKDTAEAPLISKETGLIGIPYFESGTAQGLPTHPRRASGVRFTALLNPSVEPGKLVRLESTVLPQLNGFYRVQAIRYVGDYRGNDWYMEVSATQVSQKELDKLP